MSSMKLVQAVDYPKALADSISKATTRVVLFSHIIADDETTTDLMDALCAAAERGVRVEVAGDVFTFSILGGWQVRRNKNIRKLLNTIKRMKKSGVQYHWVGQFGPILFAGRCHVKWCVVDDEVYGFGGVNLYRKGVAAADYMMQCTNKVLADSIEVQHHKIIRTDRTGKYVRSHSFQCDEGTVLIDGGIPRDSIIYNRASELTEKASHIVFVSQYCPTGKLAKKMVANDAELYFSSWKVADGLNRIFIWVNMTMTGYKTLYRKKTYIHAKFIIFTMPDGKQIALTGSHNFIRSGAVLGTREIVLETSDKGTIAELQSFLDTHII